MISAVFRRGGDVSFIVDELKAVFDPSGGQWVGGHYVPSILAAIGGVIEQHLVSIGALAPPEGDRAAGAAHGGRRRGAGTDRCDSAGAAGSRACCIARVRPLPRLRLLLRSALEPLRRPDYRSSDRVRPWEDR